MQNAQFLNNVEGTFWVNTNSINELYFKIDSSEYTNALFEVIETNSLPN